MPQTLCVSQSSLAYEGPPEVKANSLFHAVLRVELKEPIRTGGRLVLATRHVSDFGDPQITDPQAENFVAAQASRPGIQFVLGRAEDGRRHPWNRGIVLNIAAGELLPGDTVTVTLGGPGSYRCQSFVETLFQFRLGIDATGKNEWLSLPEQRCPGFRIVGNEATAVRVVLPDCTAGADGTAKKVTCRVKAEDAYGNVAGSPPQRLRLLLDGKTPAGVVEVVPHRPAVAEVAIPNDGQWHTILAASDDGRFYGESNPAGPSPVEGMRLLFGEIHSQSELCDGTQSPAELYDYARHAAGLDFAAVSSHDFHMSAADWRQMQAAAKAAHEPGRFVTFLGYEWSGLTERGGDNNVYYLDDEGPLIYSQPRRGASPAWEYSGGEADGPRSIADVAQMLKAREGKAMIVPHCGGRHCNLDFHDPAVMPLLEVHSCHRTYEHVAREAISRGLRVGFIGGSDDHRGCVGDSHPAARERYFSAHSGLAAVYARDLTREALWEAFFARRTYATNGPRIVLDVRLGGAMMGGELTAPPGEKLKLCVMTRTDGWFEAVEVYRDGAVLAYLQGGNQQNQIRLFRQELEVEVLPGPHAYHVKVRQTDAGAAWSSPIWLTGQS